MTFNDLSTPLSLVETRRSGKPRDMTGPGPDEAAIDRILKAALRVPDHGKLAPWRIVVIDRDRRDDFAAVLKSLYLRSKPDAGRLEIDAMDQFAQQGDTILAVLSCPASASKIPLWEQQLSAGALCMNLLMAIHASGYVGGWLTGAPAYLPGMTQALGGPAESAIAGFIFVGSPGKPLEERPRPDFGAIVSHWQAAPAVPS